MCCNIVYLICLVGILFHLLPGENECESRYIHSIHELTEKRSNFFKDYGKFTTEKKVSTAYYMSDSWRCVDTLEILDEEYKYYMSDELNQFTGDYLKRYPKYENVLVHQNPYRSMDVLNEHIKYIDKALGNNKKVIMDYYRYNICYFNNNTILDKTFEELNNLHVKSKILF